MNEIFYTKILLTHRLRQAKIICHGNVPTILSHDKGAILEDIEKRFRKVGYKTTKQKLNAVTYGVPQSRERLFIAGSKQGDHRFPPPQTHDLPKTRRTGIRKFFPQITPRLQML